MLRGAWCLGCLLRLVSLLGPGSCRAMLIGCFGGFGPFRAVCVCVCVCVWGGRVDCVQGIAFRGLSSS